MFFQYLARKRKHQSMRAHNGGVDLHGCFFVCFVTTSCITHAGGAAARSGEIHEDDRLVAVDGVVVKGMSAEEVCVYYTLHTLVLAHYICADAYLRAADTSEY
jgi:hypothetical protein